MRLSLIIAFGLLSSVLGLQSSSAQLPDFSGSVPLTREDGVRPEINANRVFGGINNSVAVPGVLPAPRDGATYIRRMLEDPVGLCHENWLARLACPRRVLENEDLNILSFNQLLADIRPDGSGDGGVFLDADGREPYEDFTLASVKANLADINEESPHAICYDIAAAEDWLACPVFGVVYLRLPPPESAGHLTIEDPILKKMLDRELLRVESPIILYRRGKTDPRYHLAGYLSNPSLFDFMLFRDDNPVQHMRFGGQPLPLAIAAGNFSDQPLSKNQADIAVMGTATLPHFLCQMFRNAMQTRHPPGGMPYDLPHKNDCTAGLTWVRVLNDFSRPVQEVFDALDLLVGGPAIYDLAVGKDKNKTVLFAPSNAITEFSPNGKYYVYKYYEEGMAPITHNLAPVMPQIIPPRPIEAKPPLGRLKYGPYRIAVDDINGDGYADFALTWKQTKDRKTDVGHNLWASIYSPFVSVFISSFENGKINYLQRDFSVPQWESSDPANAAQIASVAFGKYQWQKFLAAGNQKRVDSDGEAHSFVALFPVSSGIVDNLNVKVVQASVLNQKGPGVADVSVDENGNVVALSRAPFLRAPEGCDRDAGEVYGMGWTMSFSGTPGGYGLLDVDMDGVPNRCECPSLGLPNENNDADWDELIDNPACDTCAEKFNIGDFEKNTSGEIVGDRMDDACDNCPPSRCKGDMPASLCINPDQKDIDTDAVGDACDNCPNMANPQQGRVYLFVDNYGKPESCVTCPNAYVLPTGGFFTVFSVSSTERNDYEKNCIGESQFGRFMDDSDGDGIPNIRDNCWYVSNPNQEDSDQDQSGDACDCGPGGAGQSSSFNTGPEDNCDNDSVPNRFDRSPFSPSFSQVDTVYDPQMAVIADVGDLRTAGTTQFEMIPSGQSGSIWGILSDLFGWMQGGSGSSGGASGGIRIPAGQPQLIPPQQKPERLCGMSSFDYPGPVEPCHYMGSGPRELTVLLPKALVTGPAPGPITGIGSAITPCIAKVGRGGSKTVAAFEGDQKIIQDWNNKVKEITGISDYDLFVGGEAGIVHYECLFNGGAAPSVSKATGVLPNVSGNVAPFGVWQTAGLPPLHFEKRPSPDQVLKQGQAFRVAPQEAASGGEVQGKAAGISSESAVLPMPNISAVMPGISEEIVPEEGVQAGSLAYNINGQVVAKVLTSESAPGSGVELAPNDLQSLVSLDVKAYPEPFMAGKPIEERQYNVKALLEELRRRVAEKKEKGESITIDIYRDLPWEPAMKPEFVMAQNTVPEAIDAINKSLSKAMTAGPSVALNEGLVHQVTLPAYIAPVGVGLSGGGCGCRFYSGPDWPVTLVNFAVLILTFLGGVILRTQCVRRATLKKSSTRFGTS